MHNCYMNILLYTHTQNHSRICAHISVIYTIVPIDIFPYIVIQIPKLTHMHYRDACLLSHLKPFSKEIKLCKCLLSSYCTNSEILFYTIILTSKKYNQLSHVNGYSSVTSTILLLNASGISVVGADTDAFLIHFIPVAYS